MSSWVRSGLWKDDADIIYIACGFIGQLRGAKKGLERDSRRDKPTTNCVLSPFDKSTVYLLLGHEHTTREIWYFVSSRSG